MKDWQLMSAVTLGVLSTLGVYLYMENSRKKYRIPKELQSTKYDAELRACIELALKAGEEIINSVKTGDKVVYQKSAIDFVTITDKENEKLIYFKLKKLFPHYYFIGEEAVEDAGKLTPLTDDPTWIVDPIDGTTNFVHGLPFSCVSIALVVKQKPVVGVIYNPYLDELYLAVDSHGAFLNGKQLNVSKVQSVKEALMLVEFGYCRDTEGIKKITNCIQAFLAHNVHAVRMMGSGVLDLCYVASGRLDLAYTGVAGEGWKPWDYAAGGLMVTEAGGVMTDLDGKPFHLYDKSMMASSSNSLQQEAIEIIQHTLAFTR